MSAAPPVVGEGAGTPVQMSPVKRALLEIRDLRARLASVQGDAREPIAIIGMGLRLPGGADDAAALADLLWAGKDLITEVPPQRWSLDNWYDPANVAGKMTTRHGGFLREPVDQFDAEFFGISPIEAASMDPQQRLALELAWEALENAGQAPEALAGTRAGVYLGIANGDYGRSLLSQPQLMDPYFASGNAFSVASGRIAYVLGLHGPAISVDTACSSSLVALHLACQGLRHGECDLALAGGVNLILSPELNVNFSRAGMLARDGRCKTFDAAADGYVRAEGGAILALVRLRDAIARGDRVLAVIRGSAVNQDGRSNGLTAPNGPAQVAVIRAALDNAGVQAAQIGYVEAHGTGTSLGDPIEVNALGAALGAGRDSGQPLLIGSLKTNMGHLEAAAGIAGVVKAVLVLQRRQIPPHLNLDQPNPYIDWSGMPIAVPTEVTPWSAVDGPRLAGVSSFGFSGTNAHVILEEAPAPVDSPPALPARASNVLAVSARDRPALTQVVARLRSRLEAPRADAELADICFTANAGRSHFSRRVAVAGSTAAEMSAALAAFERGEKHPRLAAGEAGGQVPVVAFLFAGQGPQYLGMGQALYESSPVFRVAFDECARALDAHLPQPLAAALFSRTAQAQRLDETSMAQPAMFAIEIALAALWRSWGIEPVAVLGHSFGEYAAACIAGIISVADGARMVALRARLVQGLPQGGAMTVIEASEQQVSEALAGVGTSVSIAAVNGPTNTVISGAGHTVKEIAARFAAQGARTKALRVSHAFHSSLIEPVLDAFEAGIDSVNYAEPTTVLISSVHARRADLALLGRSQYWREHMRLPVRFADSIHALAALGVTHYVEMSPHPVLLSMGAECVSDACWLPSLRENQDPWMVMFESLQSLYCAGAKIDWAGVDAGRRLHKVDLPSYPFQRKRHWVDVPDPAASQPAAQRWLRLTEAMDRQARRGPLDVNVALFPAKWECLARVASACAARTLRDCGLFLGAGERHTPDHALSVSGIGPTYRHLVRRWLEMLVERGELRRDGDEFVAIQSLGATDLAPLWAQAELLFTDDKPLLDYVRNCASLAQAVLTGRESPLETLFPGGSFDLARGLYEHSAVMRYINALAGAAFESLGATTPAGGGLRVLEIGAGTGSTTASLLPVLPAGRTLYSFSDVSDAFLGQARARFADRDFIDYVVFDLEKDYLAQGYAPGSFDVIVAANAVHAVKDLRSALRRLHELLAPGGVLVLVESTTHLAYFDITTGLIEGWQHFADDLRSDNPLLRPATWIEALLHAGFCAAGAWPPAGSMAESMGQHVILARAPGDRAGSGLIATPSQSASTPTQTVAIPAARSDTWLLQFSSALPAERLDVLREMVRAQVMSVLRLEPGSPPARHERLMDLGMDSLMAVQLRNGLNTTLGLEKSLPSTLMFDYPTIDAIAAYLLERSAAQPAANAAMPAPVFTSSVAALDAAAIAALSDEDIAALLDERLRTP
ncbi:MAG: beta-ketoacyl synthase N-terminal-like domain-containing protein [Pseudomonadota bacterium]